MNLNMDMIQNFFFRQIYKRCDFFRAIPFDFRFKEGKKRQYTTT
jgi:hypothetical protein